MRHLTDCFPLTPGVSKGSMAHPWGRDIHRDCVSLREFQMSSPGDMLGQASSSHMSQAFFIQDTLVALSGSGRMLHA